MKQFLLGIVVGSMAAAVIYVFIIKPAYPYYIGHALDEDIIYMKSGDVIYGWILQENADSLSIGTRRGSFVLPRSKCASVRKDAAAYYMRALM